MNLYTLFSRFLQFKELEREPSLWLSFLGGEALWFWCSWSPWYISSFISWILVAAPLLRFYIINLNLETEIPLTSLSCSDKKPFSELWTHSMRFKEKASDTDSYTLKLYLLEIKANSLFPLSHSSITVTIHHFNLNVWELVNIMYISPSANGIYCKQPLYKPILSPYTRDPSHPTHQPCYRTHCLHISLMGVIVFLFWKMTNGCH